MEQQEASRREPSQAVDLVITSLVNAHVSIINTERQALWQRYSAMLLANAVLLGFFTQLQPPTRLQVYFASGFGLVLCLAWLVLTVHGFRLFLMRLDLSSRFAWSELSALDEYANPITIGIDWVGGPRGGWMFRKALIVIGLFMLAYTFLLAHHFYYIFIFFEGPR
jgi:hypothetical protein